MIEAANLPLWLACLIGALIVIGATLTLLGAFGFARLPNFYDRLHAPALGTSWGTAGIALASMIYFSVIGEKLVLHELIIGVFVMVTTPVTMMLLGGAAYARDQREAGLLPPDEGAEAASLEADEDNEAINEENAQAEAASEAFEQEAAAQEDKPAQ